MRGLAMSQVAILPTTHTKRAWLDRETLRIAAGVKGASLENLAWIVLRNHLQAGASEDAAQLDVARVISWAEARLEQISILRASPPPLISGARCAKD